MRCRTAAAVLVALSSAGCNSSPSSSSADGAQPAGCDAGCWQPTAADLTFIDSFCALTEACCSGGPPAQADLDRCRAGRRQAGVSSDQALQAACLAEMNTLAGSAACLPLPSDFSDPCTRLFNEPSGPIPVGGAGCKISADCAGAPGKVTLCSAGGPAPSGTVCLQMAVGRAGDGPCLGDANLDGIIQFAPLLQVNQPEIVIGTVCRRGDGLYCGLGNTPAERVCTPLIPDGSPCQYSRLCASGSCEDPVSGGQLISDPGAPTGMCAVRVAVGGSCGPDSSRCPAASRCDDTRTCVATLATGAACSFDEGCTNNTCSTVTHTCAPLSGLALFGYCF
jgi:hypothetical protein